MPAIHRLRAVAAVLAISLLATTVTPLASAATGSDAAVVAERRVDGRTLDLVVDSPAMGRQEKVRLLVPTGWSRQAKRVWPVLYLLHGASGNQLDWTEKGQAKEATAGRDVIVVMPNGGSCGNYTDWWNFGKGGPPAWETFHLTELRRLLERDYRASARRAIAGLSMGGGGTMTYAGRHPGMFRAAASFSGALNQFHRTPLFGQAWKFTIKLGIPACAPGTDWRALWGDPEVPAQLATWHAHNPYHLAGKLRGLRLYVSAGNGRPGRGDTILNDPIEEGAYKMGQEFLGQLRAAAIPATTHFYDGKHTWPHWQRELRAALPLLLADLN